MSSNRIVSRFDSNVICQSLRMRLQAITHCSRVILVLLMTAWAIPLFAGDDPWKGIADVKIVGNATISDAMIHDISSIRPGTAAFPGTLERAEESLANSGFFRVDSARNIRPRVTIVRDEGWYKPCDVLITVEDKPWGARVLMRLWPVAIVLIAGFAVIGGHWWLFGRWSGTAKT
jgi:hypothetical protein